MVTEGSGDFLRGRHSERELLERLLVAVRGGESRVLVVTGESGVGKSALLEFGIRSARGFRLVRAAGVESEMELAFATLHQMCVPLLDLLDRLPPPQQEALGVAFGLSPGDAPDRFLVGLAVLSLLSAAAEEQPLLCVVDDAHWLDHASAQALTFVARRLLAEPVALLFGTRAPAEGPKGFDQLVVEGLPDRDARALLGSALGVPLDERVQEQIVVETRGNPLALLELPREMTPAQLAGGFGLPGGPGGPGWSGLAGRIEESFRRRLVALPAETQRLLLVAAAEPVGDPVPVWQAARQLGVRDEAATDTDGLLAISTRVTFRHPLVRSAVYGAASDSDKQAAHRALADATDPQVDPDRRAWHLARATAGCDEDVASELERSADRAQARGGLAAAAAFLARASALTLDPSRRAERALAAAQAHHLAGAFDAALALIASAESGPLTELQRAEAERLRGQVAFALSPGRDAPPLLLKAAKRLEPLDPALARDTYLDALIAGLFAGRLASPETVLEIAGAARDMRRSPELPQPADLLLDGFVLMVTEGHAAGVPALRRALDAIRDDNTSRRRAVWLACRCAAILWDNEAWDALSARLVRLARDAGALSVLPVALTHRSGAHLFAGELGVVASLVEEVGTVSEATGTTMAPYAELGLAAFQGREAEAAQLIETAKTEVARRGEGNGLTIIHWATAALYNGLGRYEEALAAAQRAAEDVSASWFRNWGLVELVEAAARSGNADLAADAFDRLSETTSSSGTEWARGVEARSRALLRDGDPAELLYQEALERLARTPLRAELARAHLLYGEWLRRHRRRLDARVQLRTAHELFTEFGMEAFAERARVELAATGEHARKRAAATRDDLTPQEAQIARLAADGATNQEIAAQLFISPSTVDYHLRKAFRKLGVRSRHQLGRHLLDNGAAPDT